MRITVQLYKNEKIHRTITKDFVIINDAWMYIGAMYQKYKAKKGLVNIIITFNMQQYE